MTLYTWSIQLVALNKKEMVVLGREEEFRFDPSQVDYIEAYPFIYYRRIK